ncbi:AMP-binding protein [Amycolatopsis suaedae]|uniref:Acyl-CoA synthetase n=1 Tax=Amycolatopsis suaedae TaxID=2510978 RepID=A0A4Q7IYB4_9PSEU|nr:AMP-binding protein [Amycolatopsis suaedae]RZQ59242.1 acyl-CoA synthetase [Amycolatopsis suaedae]
MVTVGFFEVARAHPGRVAVIDPAGRTVTFGELAGRVNRLTRGLQGLGLGRGDGVAAVVRNGIPYVELVLATWQAGLYFTPVNYRSTADEISYILGDSGATVLVAEADLASGDPGVPHRFAIGGAPGWTDYAELGAGEPPTEPEDRELGQLMLYTSGTTGRPKGVRRPLPGTPPRIQPFQVGWFGSLGIVPGPGVHLVACPLYHAGPGSFAVNSLHLGHTLVVMPRFDAEETLRLIEAHRVTGTHLVPTMFHRLLRLPAEVRSRYDLSSLRSVVHGAAPCPHEVKRGMIDWWGPVLYEYYGASEGLVSTVGSADWLAHPGTVGRPLPGVDVQILTDGSPVPTGEVGTVYYRSPQTTFRYHGDEEKTAANRHGDFITVGDLGYLDTEGRLYLCDRRSDLILSGGVNIYPAEVEGRLLEHPGVADVAVIGVPDAEWGQRVVAVVQPTADAGPELAAALEAHCREALAGFKTPREFRFVEKLPRTESGKLPRRLVADLL